jgi:beta-lactamase regulating signal transducer with metallopeptidase domain
MDAVLNWMWQGGVVAAAAFVMLLALKPAPANIRYAVCWVALLLVVALPALPALQFPAVSADTFSAPQVDALVSLPDTWWTSTLVLLAAWIVWAGVHAARFVAAVTAIRRARSRSVPFPPDVESRLSHWARRRSGRGRAALVLSDSVTTAAVLGWGAPMIAVSPALVTTLDEEELDLVLIHEWAHVQRRDDLVNIVQIVVRMAVGWHPAVWWIDRRLHIEREIACDEAAVASTGSPRMYAECLMKLAGLRRSPRTLQAAPAVTSSGLRARIVRLVSRRPSIAPIWSRSVAVGIVTILCVMAIGVGGLTLVDAPGLALPIVSARTLSATLHQVAPVPVPRLAAAARTVAAPRREVSRLASTQLPPTAPAPLPDRGRDVKTPVRPPNAGERRDPPTPAVVNPSDTADAPPPATAPQVPPAPSDAAAEKARAPWTAATDGGVAIGRKSRDAGVATAGFFTRFARRVAGSF